MDQVDLHNKRVLIRADLNVPLQNGKILNETKLLAILPTLSLALKANAKVLLLSHLGRPKEGQYTPALSLQPIAECLSVLLGRTVRLEKNWLRGVEIAPGEVVLGENVRFNVGEEANDEVLAKQMGDLCDVLIMDAFATAHRAQASTVGIAKYAKIAVAGPLLVAELNALHAVMQDPKRPLVAIVGGAKVSGKLQVLQTLIEKVDTLIVGGGIANTFIAALGYSVGSSLYEPDLITTAKTLLEIARARSIELCIPIDVVVAEDLHHNKSRVTELDDIKKVEKIFDVGPKTSAQYKEILKQAKTILWNGPVGVFEVEHFESGTKNLAHAIAASGAFSVAGGGETLAAIDKYGIAKALSYVSTGGGAFLEYLEGKELPAVAILEARGT
jgi:phosphoglycerate kinase